MVTGPLSSETQEPLNTEADSEISFVVTFPSSKLLQNIAWGVTGYRDGERKLLEDYVAAELNHFAPRGQKITVRPYTPTP